MMYENFMTIKMRNEDEATEALEILRHRLAEGFAVDGGYKRNPALEMSNALEVVKNTIVLPKDFGCYITEDAEGVMYELSQHLAQNMDDSSFELDNLNINDYTEGQFEARYANGSLSIRYTYFPSGRYDFFFCPECGEEVFAMDDYVEGETYICPECGEKVDPTDYIPVVTEKIIQII